LALSVHTRVFAGTVCVSPATNHLTAGVRISGSTLRTGALGLVVNGSTVGKQTALVIYETWIHAVAVVAS